MRGWACEHVFAWLPFVVDRPLTVKLTQSDHPTTQTLKLPVGKLPNGNNVRDPPISFCVGWVSVEVMGLGCVAFLWLKIFWVVVVDFWVVQIFLWIDLHCGVWVCMLRLSG